MIHSPGPPGYAICGLEMESHVILFSLSNILESIGVMAISQHSTAQHFTAQTVVSMLYAITNNHNHNVHVRNYLCVGTPARGSQPPVSPFDSYERKHDGYICNCDQCDYQCSNNNSLKVHKFNIHTGGTHNCELCDNRGPTKHKLTVGRSIILS
jgi:hypothetical protein